MAAAQRAVKLTSGPDELLDPQWWHDFADHAECFKLSRVTRAEPQEGTIVQSNCVIRRFKLQIDDGKQISVVLKQVDLAKNRCAPCMFTLPERPLRR